MVGIAFVAVVLCILFQSNTFGRKKSELIIEEVDLKNNNIYIGNLNYRVRESDLQQILEEYGVVDSVKIIVDRDTKRSKGFAFAEMPNAAEAQKAIEELNQAEYEGRQMVVKEAIPRR